MTVRRRSTRAAPLLPLRAVVQAGAARGAGGAGPPAAAAAAWVRAQLPGGDVGGADEAADAIDGGHGLALAGR